MAEDVRKDYKYVELCVDMRRGRFAKDGLIQYHIVCQQVNVNSLEEVIKHFLHLSTEKAEMARNQAQALEEALDVEDLEEDKRPEDLMLSYVSGEKGKDRSDCEMVTPWFKFLWETYRTVLQILRNNSRLEALYARWELFRVAFDQAEEFVESVKQRIGSECLVDEANGSSTTGKPGTTSLAPISAMRFEQMSKAVRWLGIELQHGSGPIYTL